MGKLPIILIAGIALWIAVQMVRQGPEKALGGLFGLLDAPQYGEQARPTRTGKLADQQLDPAAHPKDEPDSPWWSQP